MGYVKNVFGFSSVYLFIYLVSKFYLFIEISYLGNINLNMYVVYMFEKSFLLFYR